LCKEDKINKLDLSLKVSDENGLNGKGFYRGKKKRMTLNNRIIE